MSGTDFGDMRADLLAEFGQRGFVTRGVDEPVPVTVVIARNIVETGEHGRAIRRMDIACFRVAEWQPKEGDRLTVGAWTKFVRTLEADDGLIAQAVMQVEVAP